MGDGRPPIGRGCGAAGIAVGLALLLTLAWPQVRSDSPTALFFAAVMISSWYGGLGPGLLATALSTALIDYLVVPPAFTVILQPGDVVRIAVFVMVALLISSLNLARRRLEAQLRRKADELIAADRHKDEFLAVLAHELRNPLAAIGNVLYLMRQEGGLPNPEARDIIDRQIRQMARLIDDLLDAARVARGVITLQREEVDLATVVTHAVGTVRPMIEDRGQALSVSLPPEPMPMEADPARLEQVLVNLLSNASRYTDPGGSIAVVARREGDDRCLVVRDTGVGIAPEMLPQIFGLFVQADRDRSRMRGGLGIGLALVRGLVELHEGTIEARSEGPGRGSEFLVRLPATPALRRDDPGHGAPSPDLRRDRLLFVADGEAVPFGFARRSPRGWTPDCREDQQPAAAGLGPATAESRGRGRSRRANQGRDAVRGCFSRYWKPCLLLNLIGAVLLGSPPCRWTVPQLPMSVDRPSPAPQPEGSDPAEGRDPAEDPPPAEEAAVAVAGPRPLRPSRPTLRAGRTCPGLPIRPTIASTLSRDDRAGVCPAVARRPRRRHHFLDPCRRGRGVLADPRTDPRRPVLRAGPDV